MELKFAMDGSDQYWQTNPVGFLGHLIGYEGAGSILAYLKKLNWASSLGAGAGSGASGFEVFSIAVELTADGLGESFPRPRAIELTLALDHWREVVLAIFSFIKILKNEGCPKFSFDELAS